jgi:[ribosomal protein S18]-alanine N-acetyltransferase
LDIDDRIIIQTATPQHLPDILWLERQSPTAGHWSAAQYGCLFQAEEGPHSRLVLVAGSHVPQEPHDRKITIVGFLIARDLGPEWELENIVVAEEVRGEGVGRRLMQELLARAQQRNSHTIFLEVRESNASAISLYEKLGFQQTGRRKSYYSNPVEDALLYCKNLGQGSISS